MSGKDRKPTNPLGNNLPMQFPMNHVSFDAAAFDNLMRANGVRVKHMKAVIDPRGVSDYGTNRTTDPVGNSDGFIYKEAGCFTASFQNNGKEVLYEVEGEIDSSSVMMTPPRFYDGTEEPVIIDVWDRFELLDVEIRVVTKELVEASTIGRERLRFPALCVEFLIGSDGFEYKQDVHFKVNCHGEIEWITQQRPGYNEDLARGEMYSIRYRYIPYYVVRRLVHEVRVSQITRADGQRFVERLPYQVQLSRENVFKDKIRTSDAPAEDPRFKDVPSTGNILGNRS